MKVLITGAGGKIGVNIANKLKGSYDLVYLDRAPSKFLPEGKFYQADVSDNDALSIIFSEEKPDIVIHLAGLMKPLTEENHELAYRINTESTENLGTLACKFGVKKFIFASVGYVLHVG